MLGFGCGVWGLGLFIKGYTGIMENNMENTIVSWRCTGLVLGL